MCNRRGAGVQMRPGRRPFQDCSECTFDCGDLYARKVDLILPSGRTHYNTCAGGCISMLVVIATLCLLVLHLSELMDENVYVIQKAVAKGWYTDSDVIKGSEFQIAVGLVDLNDLAGEAISEPL